MKAFKAYDIRGVYNRDFDKEDVYKIGFFLPKLLAAKKVLVGYDVRMSTPEIFKHLCRGITDAGADVYSIGKATTPMVYFSTAELNFDASVQITASHNPKEYNGLKISKTKALPVGYETGLAELEKMMQTESVIPVANKGSIYELEAKEAYLNFLKKYTPDMGSLKLGVDCSNGMASLFIHEILGNTPHYLYDTLDGTFPNHEPNPLDEENLADLKALVLKEKLDIGVIYDGDADRVMFVDEKGQFISPDLITALLAEYYLKKEKAAVLYDIRTSRAVKEHIVKLGGTPHMWKVGHAFAKLKLKEVNAIVGGELAGHYYFRDFYNCDSGILASLIVLNVLVEQKKAGRTISDLIHDIAGYAFSGEMNFKIAEKTAAMEELKSLYETQDPTALYDFDGYRIEFADWWFNVRLSNTEPYLRLVVEANDQALLDQKVNELKTVLKRYQ